MLSTSRRAWAVCGFKVTHPVSPAHAVDVEASVGGLWFQGGEIVLEDEGRGVRRIVNPAGPGVSGAKVASRVVGGLGRGLELRYFSLPGTRGAMGRDQHPFVGQRIQSAMRIFGEFQIAASQHFTTSGGEVRTVIMVMRPIWQRSCPRTTMRQGAPGFLAGQPRRLSLRESEVHGHRALPIIRANNSGR